MQWNNQLRKMEQIQTTSNNSSPFIKKRTKRKLNRNGKILIAVLSTVIIVFMSCSIVGFFTSPVGKSNQGTLVVIETGDTYSSIATFLKEKKLIRSEFFYKLYVKLAPPKASLKAGKHILRPNMSLKKIIQELQVSPNNDKTVMLTFKEGLNMRSIASMIAKNTKNTEDSVYALLKDETYLNELIQKYWFLSDEIKNPEIYYSLEGYLYPNTYEFDKNASVKDIFQKMLDETARQLKNYEADFKKSKYSVHQIMTIASISELEAISESDRENVARVFYNRLDQGMSLGSDVTTYYAAKVNVGQRDLYQSEIDASNAYNTRSASMAGKLPVGPICNPSISAIKTAIQPKGNNYLYFVADKNRKVYFTTNEAEHDAIIKKLIKEDLWYTFD